MNHPAEGRTAGKHPKRKEGRPKATNHQSHALTERKRTTRTKTGNLFFPTPANIPLMQHAPILPLFLQQMMIGRT
jgi:hypothetical protein